MRSVRDIFRSHAVFNEEGRHVNGTDKQSNHNYGDAYEKLFTTSVQSCSISPTVEWISTRDKVQLVMEVGVADGSSLLAWCEVFPNATVVGMDIQPAVKKHERIEFHFGDQRSKVECEAATAGRQFDLIVEDATHILANNLLTLYWLWPHVRPGGLYVVEEWDSVDRDRIRAVFPYAEIVDTDGPFGGIEPLVVFRKPF